MKDSLVAGILLAATFFVVGGEAAVASVVFCDTKGPDPEDNPAMFAELAQRGFVHVFPCPLPSPAGAPQVLVYSAATEAKKGPLGACLIYRRVFFRVKSGDRDVWSESLSGKPAEGTNPAQLSMYLPKGDCVWGLRNAVALEGASEDVFIRFHAFWMELMKTALHEGLSRSEGDSLRRDFLADLRRGFARDIEPRGRLVSSREDAAAGRYIFETDDEQGRSWSLSLTLSEGHFVLEKFGRRSEGWD